MDSGQDPLARSGLGRADAAVALAGVLARWHDAPGPVYQRLAEAMRAAIASGAVAAGARLPAERALADRLALSRTTVVAAYALLRADGWLESRHGSGSWARLGDGAAPPGSPHRLSRVLGEVRADAIDFRCASLPDLGAVTRRFLSLADELPSWAGETGYYPLGLPELRRAIARHVTRWGLPTREEQILVTAGAQQAMGLVAALYVRRGDAVALEDPTHMGAIDVLQAMGARLLPVPVGRDGIRLDALRRTVERERPRLISLVPTFHNPTGAVLPVAARQRLARLCEELDVPLLENNALGDLALDAEPPPPIAAFSADAPILTVGSLSKLVWAGLRIGWVRAAEPVIARLAPLKTTSDYGTSVLSQAAALRFFRDADRIRALRQRQIAERRAALFRELDRQLPSWSYARPAGGPSTWARLPHGSAIELAPVALRHGVSILPGDVFSPSGGFADHLRLPFMLEPALIREGVTRLARAWSAYTADHSAKPHLRVIV